MVAKCEYIYKQQQKQKKRKQMKGSYEVLVLELSVPAGPTSFPSCSRHLMTLHDGQNQDESELLWLAHYYYLGTPHEHLWLP